MTPGAQLDVKAVVAADGATASFVINRIGTFIVRRPDAYSTPMLDYDAATKDGAKTNEDFVPALGFGLHRIPCYSGAQACVGTIPIILIHGVGSHEETQEAGHAAEGAKLYARWDNFISWAVGPDGNGGTADDGLDLNTYQLWLFLHNSDEPMGYDRGAAGEFTPNNVKELEAEIDRGTRRKQHPFQRLVQQVFG